MFEEWKDKEAAEKEFLEMLGETEKSIKIKLLGHFVKGFKQAYRVNKINFTAVNEDYERDYANTATKQRTSKGFFLQIQHCSHLIREEYLSKKNMANEKNRAFYLGYTLGMFLAIVEYGLTSRIVTDFDTDHCTSLQEIMLQLTENISQRLKELNKSVNHKFIRNRVNKIANKHADTLSEEQQKLIAKIAAQFV